MVLATIADKFVVCAYTKNFVRFVARFGAAFADFLVAIFAFVNIVISWKEEAFCIEAVATVGSHFEKNLWASETSIFFTHISTFHHRTN